MSGQIGIDPAGGGAGSPSRSPLPTLGAGNLADLLRATATRLPGAVALVHTSPGGVRSTTSWVELDGAVDATAAGVRSGLDLAEGDRVALTLGNTPAFVIAYFALLRAGLVAVPVNTGYTAPRSRGCCTTLTRRSCSATTAPLPSCRRPSPAPTGCWWTPRAWRHSPQPAARPHGTRPHRPRTERGGEDLAVLMFTSGTSGRPRAAMLSHRALLTDLAQCQALDPTPMRDGDVVLLVLPLFHIYGLNTGLGMVVATGATAVLEERFDPVATATTVRAEGVTNIPGAPPMYVGWAAADALGVLRDVRMLASGASPLPPVLLEQAQTEAGVAIYEGYGLTETAPVASSTLASPRIKPGSIGRPVPGVEVRLLNEDGSVVADGDPGEVSVRGTNLFSGYWPDGADGPDAAGWWATGDVADADADGGRHRRRATALGHRQGGQGPAARGAVVRSA